MASKKKIIFCNSRARHRIWHGGKTTVKECIKNSCTASGCRAQFLDRTARHGKTGNVQAEKRVELKKIVLEYYSDSDS